MDQTLDQIIGTKEIPPNTLESTHGIEFAALLHSLGMPAAIMGLNPIGSSIQRAAKLVGCESPATDKEASATTKAARSSSSDDEEEISEEEDDGTEEESLIIGYGR